MKILHYLLILAFGALTSASDQAIPFNLGPVKHYVMKTKIKGVTDESAGGKSEFNPYVAVWGVFDAGNPAFITKSQKSRARKLLTDDEFSMGTPSSLPPDPEIIDLLELNANKVILGGKTYVPSNLKTKTKGGIFYYCFEIRGQNPVAGLPDDLLTGSITAVSPEKRTRLPINIIFNRGEKWNKNSPCWVGKGEIEESTMVSLYEFKKIFK